MVELCWGCELILHEKPDDNLPEFGVVSARSPLGKVLNQGWHRYHRWCVPDGYEIREDD